MFTMSAPLPLQEGTKGADHGENDSGWGLFLGVGWSAHEVQTIARQAEKEAEIDTICAAEVNNDVMATAQLMRGPLRPGSRWPRGLPTLPPAPLCLCAGGSVAADVTGGHLVLGLGVSHEPIKNQALGMDLPEPQAALRRYVTAVRNWLGAKGEPIISHSERAAYPVPVYVAALAWPAVELGGEFADGIMPFLWSAARVTQSKVSAARGRAKASDLAPLDLTHGLPTFLGNDLEAITIGGAQTWNLHHVAFLPAPVPGPWDITTRPRSWNVAWARMR